MTILQLSFLGLASVLSDLLTGSIPQRSSLDLLKLADVSALLKKAKRKSSSC